MSDTITLAEIKAELRRLAGIIAQYETQPVKWDKPVLIMPPKLDKGERWAGALITPSRREHWTPLAAPNPVYRAGAWDFMQHPSLYGSKQGESK